MGWETACWHAVLIRVLIWREFGVLYNRHYVCTLLHNLGFSFQKARFVSDHLDAAKRLVWLQDQWPTIFRAAKRCKGLILFEDEASFAQGLLELYLGAPWPPAGGALVASAKATRSLGRSSIFLGVCSLKASRAASNSESYQAFLQMIMAQTTEHLFLIHDGARYHTSASTTAFLAAHKARLRRVSLALVFAGLQSD